MDGILPNDETLYERSKSWAKFLKKYEQKGDTENRTLYELLNEEDVDSDNEIESISSAEFEDNETEDGAELDIAEVSQTLEAIEKRKQQWKMSGIDSIMDSFCLDKIIDKVGSWLGNNTDYFSSHFNDSHRNGKKLVNHFEMQKKTYINHEADQDSAESVNTIKYVLSNRKPRKTKLTTMTIKSYRFSQKLSAMRRKEYPITTKKAVDDKLLPEEIKYGPLKKISFDINRNSKTIEKKTNQRKFSYNQRNRSLPLGNSDTDDDSIVPRKTYSRSSRKKMKTKRTSRLQIRSSSSSNDDRRCEPKNVINRKIRKADEVHKKCSEPGLIKTNNNNLIVNSTSAKAYESMLNHKQNFASDCKKVKEIFPESVEKRYSESDQIVLYSPEKADSISSSVSSVRITENYLSDKLGEVIKSKYFSDCKNLIYECPSTSRLLYITPKLNEKNISSDDDVLDKTKKSGRLVEICYDF